MIQHRYLYWAVHLRETHYRYSKLRIQVTNQSEMLVNTYSGKFVIYMAKFTIAESVKNSVLSLKHEYNLKACLKSRMTLLLVIHLKINNNH